MSKVKVLIVGASGMLGHAIIRLLNDDVEQFEVIGTLRGTDTSLYAENMHRVHFCENVDVLTTTPLNTVFQIHEPDVVINCVGLIKQRPNAEDPIEAINLNALFPHRLAQMCNRFGARLIQISTDCVFSGKSGRYSEEDTPDAIDFYGRSKLLGEVTYGNAVTLRTSIIGHELYRRDS
ncbi:sugar nucleotide-binding protein, partial [Ekhidna sp.]